MSILVGIFCLYFLSFFFFSVASTSHGFGVDDYRGGGMQQRNARASSHDRLAKSATRGRGGRNGGGRSGGGRSGGGDLSGAQQTLQTSALQKEMRAALRCQLSDERQRRRNLETALEKQASRRRALPHFTASHFCPTAHFRFTMQPRKQKNASRSSNRSSTSFGAQTANTKKSCEAKKTSSKV